MSYNIQTNLGRTVELSSGQFFNLKLNCNSDISRKARIQLFNETVSYLRSCLQQNPALVPSRITPGGMIDREGNLHTNTERFWSKANPILKKGRVAIAFPDPLKSNLPEPLIHKEGIGTALFENVREPHYLEGIAYPRKEPLRGESRANFIRRCTQEFAEQEGKTFDPQKKAIQESLAGVALSLDRRSNYRSTLRFEGTLAGFFGQERNFTSTEVFARNGIAPGAVSASLNRYSDRVNLMRSLESEDGSVDSLSGRAHDLKTAKEMAGFAFLAQMNLYAQNQKRNLAQGITKRAGVFEFRFAIQSLLPMLFGGALGGEEIKMVYKEIAAYQELAKQGIQEIADPANPAQIYKVRFLPLPVAAVQFNSLTRVESLLPQAISGEYDARLQTDRADQVLYKIAVEKSKVSNASLQSRINDTVYFLKKKESLKPWQEILTRAYLCHLLEIPLIVHCKSCVDRTNVVNAMTTAMKQWMRAGKEIPKIDGKTAIFSLPEVSIQTDTGLVHPFKELFAFNLHKGLKITELARGEKGYQYFRGFRQYPALVDLLPARYIKGEEKPSFFKRWIIPISATLLPPLLLQILLSLGAASRKDLDQVWGPQKKLWKRGLIGKGCAVALTLLGLFPWQILVWLAAFASSFRTKDWRKIAEAAALPFKFIKNANHLYPEKTLNEEDLFIGPRRLLAPG
jgi:hypothetical protein